MIVVVGADPSAEGLMEALIGGTDQPPFLQEVSAGFVGHSDSRQLGREASPDHELADLHEGQPLVAAPTQRRDGSIPSRCRSPGLRRGPAG